jgi:hypothetical protein
MIPKRAALEKGLKSSWYLIALLTSSYTRRKWTQREVDLFDLKANRTRRRTIGIQVAPVKDKKIDQVFRVSQWLRWNVDGFDPEGFWLLYCGRKNEKPGTQAEWASKGTQPNSSPLYTTQLITAAPGALLPPTSTEPTTTTTAGRSDPRIGLRYNAGRPQVPKTSK